MSIKKEYPYHRRSIRMKEYDYHLAGAYFLTIITHKRKCILGTVGNCNMHLSLAGLCLQKVWNDLPSHYPDICLDAFCIMPNHVHAIIVIQDQSKVPLSEVVRALKSFSARRINASSGRSGEPVWQRNYYEHIIRSQAEWEKIHLYILSNPEHWESDPEYEKL